MLDDRLICMLYRLALLRLGPLGALSHASMQNYINCLRPVVLTDNSQPLPAHLHCFSFGGLCGITSLVYHIYHNA